MAIVSFDAVLAPQRPSPERLFRYESPLQLGGDAPAVFLLRYAGESNAAYMSALYAHVPIPGRPSPARAQLIRERDAKTFAATVVAGWEGICHSGAPVPFSVEQAESLLISISRARPNVFDALCAHAQVDNNFVGSAAEIAAALGKS